jgi:hypothetical protein
MSSGGLVEPADFAPGLRILRRARDSVIGSVGAGGPATRAHFTP